MFFLANESFSIEKYSYYGKLVKNISILFLFNSRNLNLTQQFLYIRL